MFPMPSGNGLAATRSRLVSTSSTGVMRRLSRAGRLTSQRSSSHGRLCTLSQRHFHNSTTALQVDQGGTTPSSAPRPQAQSRTNKGRVQDALKQVARLRESRAQAQAQAQQAAANKASQAPPPNLVKRVVNYNEKPSENTADRKRPVRRERDSAQDTSGRGPRGSDGGSQFRSIDLTASSGDSHDSDYDVADGRRGGRPGRGSRGGGTRGRGGGNNSAAKKRFNDEDDEGDMYGDGDREQEDEEYEDPTTDEIVSEAADEHFATAKEANYYSHLLEQARMIQTGMTLVETYLEDNEIDEESTDAWEVQQAQEAQQALQRLNEDIDNRIIRLMDDLIDAPDYSAPPHPIQPFDHHAEFHGMLGGVPTGASGMGNTVEQALRTLGDREDGGYRDPTLLGQRLLNGDLVKYNTLVERSETHIRAGHLRNKDVEDARKERNASKRPDAATSADLAQRRLAARAEIRNLDAALASIGDMHGWEAERTKLLERRAAQQEIINETTAKRDGYEQSAHKPLRLSLEQRRELVERIVKGRYHPVTSSEESEHPALQNVARILGANASYRPDGRPRVLDVLRSMMPSESGNVGKERRA